MQMASMRLKYEIIKDWTNFLTGFASDFVETLYTHEFWEAYYEYDSENTRKFDFHGQNHKNPIKVMVSGVFFENH